MKRDLTGLPESWRKIDKAKPRTLYVQRKVLNAAEIIKWAKAQGFPTTLPADDMHVTICFSRTPVDWMKIGEAWSNNDDGGIEVKPGSVRLVERLGDKGAVVLMFNSNDLAWRHEDFKRIGATWDHEEYQPHITITYDVGDFDPNMAEPYRGAIKLGPEIFEEVNENWTDGIVEKKKHVRIAKIDEEHGVVFGWAITCKIDGEDYYDLNIDRDTGERVPEHIPEPSMLKAAVKFASKASRPGNEMHKGPLVGEHMFMFPMTTEIADGMGVTTKQTGLMVGYKPPPHVLAKFKSGEYSGFSIEGIGEGSDIDD